MKKQEIREKAKEFFKINDRDIEYNRKISISKILDFAETLQSDVSVSDEEIDNFLIGCGFHINTKNPLQDIITDTIILRMLVKEVLIKYTSIKVNN